MRPYPKSPAELKIGDLFVGEDNCSLVIELDAGKAVRFLSARVGNNTYAEYTQQWEDLHAYMSSEFNTMENRFEFVPAENTEEK